MGGLKERYRFYDSLEVVGEMRDHNDKNHAHHVPLQKDSIALCRLQAKELALTVEESLLFSCRHTAVQVDHYQRIQTGRRVNARFVGTEYYLDRCPRAVSLRYCKWYRQFPSPPSHRNNPICAMGLFNVYGQNIN
jgi:hypothetical protein